MINTYKNMKLLIVLNHPAHYFVFKYSVLLLKDRGYEIQYVICNKDILENLLINEGVDYIKINERRKRKQSFFSVAINGIIQLIKQDLKLFKLTRKIKPQLLLGTDISITHVGKLLNIPSFVFNEDDYEINKFFCKFSYPFATKIVSPNVCSVGKYVNKKIAYNGFQKMAYLHPKYFSPNFLNIKDIVDVNEIFFVIRLVSLTSGHDEEEKHYGISNDILDIIIEKLSKRGKIFISSEKSIIKKYQQYALFIEPNKIHHLLNYASLFIGDSQSMAVEASMLGVPNIRFNDFAGKISVLEELEHTYGLTYGIKTNNPQALYNKIDELLMMPNLKDEFQTRRRRMLADKIDVTAFFAWFIENYPESKKIMKENPDYQYRFK